MSYRSTHSNNSTMRKLPLKLSLAKMIAWPIVIIVSMVGCSPSDEFTYQVRVQAADTDEYIQGASVTIEIEDKVSLNASTDSSGIARFTVSSFYANKPGMLIVEAKGYEQYTQNVDLVPDALPEPIQITRSNTDGTPSKPPTLTPTPIASMFAYQVRVQAEDTGMGISNAKVIIQVGGKVSLDDITDANGQARVFIHSSLAGKPGELIVEASGYAAYRKHIDLVENPLPELVSLEPSPSATPSTATLVGMKVPTNTLTTSPTPTPIAIPTSTLTPTPEPPTSTPTPTPKPPTSIPTSTPIPTVKPPTLTPSATPLVPALDVSGKLAVPLMLGYEAKVYVTGFDGEGINGPKPVSQFGCQPMFCRNGNSIIVNGTAANLSGVFVMDSRGQNPEVLIDRDSAYWPAFSPDCSQVMFSEMTLDRRLHRRKSDGTILEVLANNRPILARNTLWSDDNRLVFWGCAVWLEQPGECGIWVTPADDIEPVRVVTTSGRPMDVKNGWLAYMSAEDGDWDIYLVSLDDGQSKNITNNNSQDGLAAIAPDGKHVAYVSNVSGNWALWSITIDGREKRKWFDIDPRRGAINLETWAEGRMSWAR